MKFDVLKEFVARLLGFLNRRLLEIPVCGFSGFDSEDIQHYTNVIVAQLKGTIPCLCGRDPAECRKRHLLKSWHPHGKISLERFIRCAVLGDLGVPQRGLLANSLMGGMIGDILRNDDWKIDAGDVVWKECPECFDLVPHGTDKQSAAADETGTFDEVITDVTANPDETDEEEATVAVDGPIIRKPFLFEGRACPRCGRPFDPATMFLVKKRCLLVLGEKGCHVEMPYYSCPGAGREHFYAPVHCLATPTVTVTYPSKAALTRMTRRGNLGNRILFEDPDDMEDALIVAAAYMTDSSGQPRTSSEWIRSMVDTFGPVIKSQLKALWDKANIAKPIYSVTYPVTHGKKCDRCPHEHCPNGNGDGNPTHPQRPTILWTRQRNNTQRQDDTQLPDGPQQPDGGLLPLKRMAFIEALEVGLKQFETPNINLSGVDLDILMLLFSFIIDPAQRRQLRPNLLFPFRESGIDAAANALLDQLAKLEPKQRNQIRDAMVRVLAEWGINGTDFNGDNYQA